MSAVPSAPRRPVLRRRGRQTPNGPWRRLLPYPGAARRVVPAGVARLRRDNPGEALPDAVGRRIIAGSGARRGSIGHRRSVADFRSWFTASSCRSAPPRAGTAVTWKCCTGSKSIGLSSGTASISVIRRYRDPMAGRRAPARRCPCPAPRKPHVGRRLGRSHRPSFWGSVPVGKPLALLAEAALGIGNRRRNRLDGGHYRAWPVRAVARPS
jgi:hypothetical protein